MSARAGRRGRAFLRYTCAMRTGLGTTVLAAAALVLAASTVHADERAEALSSAMGLSSADLRAVNAALAAPLAAVRHAAPGVRHVVVLGHRTPVGRTYGVHFFRLGTGNAAAARTLFAVMRAFAHPDEDDGAWYERATPVASALPAAQLAEAFGTDSVVARPGAAERAAVETLAAAVLAAAAAHPALTLHRAQAGWSDVVGSAYHGVMLVDPRSREALWCHTDETWDDE